ncbi:hypothetical protein [Fodinibacter luteus]|uniref:hypothetical protein n=1 Tax=Fodinibacter luteus TaxID=552064 RepID=UPI0031F0415C
MTIRAAHALRAAALAGATLLASGCAVFSPVQTDVDYPAGDGVRLSIDGLELRNLALVVPEENGTAVLIGQAVNSGTSAVDVTFTVQGAPTSAAAAIPASSGDTLSGTTTRVEIESLPAAPGDNVELVVSTAQAGENVVTVPVLPATGYYEGLTTG